MNSHQVVVVAAFLSLAPLFVGCGKQKGLGRLPLHGKVTLANGTTVSGTISFLPAPGHAGPAATTKLAEGNYWFDGQNGPTTGPHTIIIKRIAHRDEQLKLLAAKTCQPPTKSEWTQSADISDDGQYLHDIKLND